MSERAMGRSTHLVARPWRARAARAALWCLLVLATTSLGGCGFNLFGSKSADVTKKRTAEVTKKGTKKVAKREVKEPESDEPKTIAEAHERVTSFPGDPYWRYRLGRFYVDADSLPAGEHELRAALAQNPTYAPALASLSQLYYKTGRHEEAVRLLEPARSRPDAFTPEARQALMAGMALHLDALGRPDLAGAMVPRDAEDLKRTGPAMVYVGLRGEHPDSVAKLARETLRDSRSAVNLNNYGITLLRAADPKGARKAFKDAIERDPDLPGPYYNLAIVERFFFVDDEAAGAYFRDYWKRSHDDPDSLRTVFAKDPVKSVAQKDGDR